MKYKHLTLCSVLMALVTAIFTLPIKAKPMPVNKTCHSEQLQAFFSQTTSNQLTNQTSLSHFQLLRHEQRVAHYNEQDDVVNIWFLNRHKKQQLTRIFERYQQGIEYQPSEIKSSGLWQSQRNLVIDSLLAKMTPMSTTGEGCQQRTEYQFKAKHLSYRLHWLNAIELPEYLEVINQQTKQAYTLKLAKLVTGDKVRSKFKLWDSLPTTDYADIGDNENNPFLAKMIHQGFANNPAQHNHHH